MDWNNDGKMDLIAGDSRGQVSLFLNVGSKGKPRLAAAERVKAAGIPIGPGTRGYTSGKATAAPSSHKLSQPYSKLHMGDWDGDGLKDLLVGHTNTMVLYKNAGTPSAPDFQAPVLIESPDGKWPMRPSPYLVDWDKDGTTDLLVGSERAEVFFHRNEGTNKSPKLAKGQRLVLKGDGFDKGYRCRIGVTDWNNDGKLDLLVGNFYSTRSGQTRKAGGNVWLFLGS